MTAKPQIKFDPAVLELIPQDSPVWARFEAIKPGDLLLFRGILSNAYACIVVGTKGSSFYCYSLVKQRMIWHFKEVMSMRTILMIDQVLEYNRTHQDKPLLVRNDHLAEMIDITVVI